MQQQQVIAIAIYLHDRLGDTVVILITRNVHLGKHPMYTDYRYVYISAHMYA